MHSIPIENPNWLLYYSYMCFIYQHFEINKTIIYAFSWMENILRTKWNQWNWFDSNQKKVTKTSLAAQGYEKSILLWILYIMVLLLNKYVRKYWTKRNISFEKKNRTKLTPRLVSSVIIWIDKNGYCRKLIWNK